MPRLDGVRRLLRITRNRAGIDRAVDDELRFHFEMTMRDLMANGMTPDDARKEAERRFGDVDQTRARLATIDRALASQERRADWWSAFTQDTRYALRGLRMRPGFTFAVIVTLALGIGANATMFGIVDRLLFRPPTYLDAPERATRIYISRYRRGTSTLSSSTGYKRYIDLRDWTTSFDAMTPFTWNYRPVGSGEATRVMNVGLAGADLWKMFTVTPVIGRFFTAEEDTPANAAQVVVLAYNFWQTQFGGRRDVLGTTIDIADGKYTVIGVAPERFSGFSSTPLAVFVPMSAGSGGMGAGWHTRYNASWFEIFARRKPGASQEAASADLNGAYQRSYRAQLEANRNTTPFDVAKPTALAGPVLADRGPTASNDAKVATWLIGVAGIVLLIACANVANLLLARALRRRREIAVRIALGVSRARLATQLFTESMLLAVAGGGLGLAIAHWGGVVVRATLLGDAAGSEAIADPRMLAFAAALAVVTGLLTGLAPALQTGRSDVSAALKSGSREGIAHRSRLRSGLLLSQAALSVVLLVGAGLFLRSLQNVRDLRLGYDADRLLWLEPNDRGARLDSATNVALRENLVARARTLPGVEGATRALSVPFYSSWEQSVFVAGVDSVNRLGRITLQAVAPGFFETMGTRLLRGRAITREDRAGAPRVMVVGEIMAKRIWPAQDALGKCVKLGSDTTPCFTVVGIAEDVRRGTLADVEMHYYVPMEQYTLGDGGLFVRTRGRAAERSEEIRRALQASVPGTTFLTVTPLGNLIGGEARSWRLGATMFAVFGGLALVLAAIGLYSVIAYSVTQRTHEMGVRVALGAQSGDVIGLIVREGLRLTVPGVVLGGIAALAAGKWIAPLLFQVSPKDPAVMVAVVTTLIAVAIAASWWPARRASRVNPTEALRAD